MEIIITKENFEAEVLKNKKTVLIDFWATWCGPCKMIAPVIEEIAEENEDITVGKVNVDEQPELAAAFGVQSIPMLVVVRDGRVVNKAIGYQPKNDILNLLEV